MSEQLRSFNIYLISRTMFQLHIIFHEIMPSWATSWRPFWKIAATAARGQFGDGSTPKFAYYILVYLCAKIGAFIK